MKFVPAFGTIVGIAVSIMVVGLSIHSSHASSPASPALAPTDVSLSIDCDTTTAGIQSSCTQSAAGPLDVAVVLTNNSASDLSISSFNFDVVGDNKPVFTPNANVDGNRNGNPDLNDAAFPNTGTFNCNLPAPQPDADIAGDPVSTSRSRIVCFTGANDGPTFATGTSVVLATVHYTVSGTSGVGNFSFSQVAINDNAFNEVGSCNDAINNPIDCFGATVTLGTGPATSVPTPVPPTTVPTPVPPTTVPTPVPPTTVPTPVSPTTVPTPVPPTAVPTPIGPTTTLALDCDTATPGIQATCSQPSGGGPLDIAVVFSNNSGSAVTITAFNFDLVGDNKPQFTPNAGVDANKNGNPDFNEAGLPTLNCSLPAPQPDFDQPGDGVATTRSRLVCFTGATDGPTVAAGATLVFGTVHYTVSGANGVGNFSLENVALTDNFFLEVGSCNPLITNAMICSSAVVTIGSGAATPVPPTTVPTPIPPTSVPTPVPPTAVPTRVPTVTPTSCGGADVNHDGRVNSRDVLAVTHHFGAHGGTYDVNHDGRVNARDLQIVVHCFHSPTPVVVGRPDLVIQGLRYFAGSQGYWDCRGGIVGGEAAYTEVTVSNTGRRDAASFVVDVNGQRQTVAGLAGGQSTVLKFGTYASVIATVDVLNQIAESDESNNQKTIEEIAPSASWTPVPTGTICPTPTSFNTATATPT